MPLLGSFTQIGVREELADYVAVVDAKATPFVSMAPKGKDIGNMTFSWQVDNYSATTLTNIGDGVDVASADHTNASAGRARMSNYAQVFRRNHRTGFIADTSNVAGVSSETAKGVAKRLVELKRDMECAFLATANVASPAIVGLTPSLSASLSLGASLGYTLNTSGTGVGQSPTNYAPTVSATGAVNTTVSASITETIVQGMLASIYGNIGAVRDYDLLCGTTIRRAMTNLASPVSSGAANTFSSIRTFNKDLADSTFKSSIDVFEGDFGRLLIQPDVFIGGYADNANASAFSAAPHKAYIIPSDMVEIRYSKLPEVKDLPDAGGGPIKLIQAIAGLVVKNPLGFGMFHGAS